jgi:DNA-binding NtrC family response regulator
VLSESALAQLERHSWPGNVRELKNVMQRAALLAKGSELAAADLGLPVQGASAPEAETAIDKEAIEQALARASGVVAQAAHELGLSRQALYRRMDRFGISRNPAESQ